MSIRVLFLDHTARLGGGEIALINLLGEFARGSDVEPRVVVFEDGPMVGRLRERGVACDVFPLSDRLRTAKKDGVGVGPGSLMKVPAAVGFVRRLARFIREAEVDLVYCNSLKADVLGGMAARLAKGGGVPCVWHVRDRVMPDYLPAKVVPVFRRLCRWVPQGIAANSEHTLETLKLPVGWASAHHPHQSTGDQRWAEAHPTKSKPARVVYSGVVPPVNVMATPEGSPVVGLVGRLAPWKGQHVFLDAAAVVRQQMPGVRFRLIGSALFGEDDYERRLRKRVAEPDLSGSVEFCGFEDDIWSALAKLTIVAHASTTPEPFGQVVVEAMAAGRAVVATDAGGVRETIVDNTTGLLVPMNDSPAMAAALLRLIRDPAERQRLAQAGRERALSHFHITQTAQSCLSLIRQVAAGDGSGEPLAAERRMSHDPDRR